MYIWTGINLIYIAIRSIIYRTLRVIVSSIFATQQLSLANMETHMNFEDKKVPVQRIKPAFLNRKEAAEYISIGTTKLDELAKDGTITKCEIGSRVLYSVSQLDQFHDDLLAQFSKKTANGGN